jgi:hypothetical protein
MACEQANSFGGLDSPFMGSERFKDLVWFFGLLHQPEVRLGGKRTLAIGRRGVVWPRRGVCSFFENGEKHKHEEIFQ